MKLFYIVAGLSALYGAEAATESTITCSACLPPSSVNDIVTRSAATITPSCSAASFTIISSQPGMSSSAIAPTGTSTATVTGIVPVFVGNRNIAAGITGVLAVAAMTSYFI